MAYTNLIGQVIDKNNPAFADFPVTLDGQIYIDGDAAEGWITEENNSLAEAKTILRGDINEERDFRLNHLTVQLDGVTYDADAAGRENINGIVAAITAGVPVTEPVNWRDAGDVTQQLSHSKLIELAALMIDAVQNVYETSWSLKAQIDAAPNVSAAQTITWS